MKPELQQKLLKRFPMLYRSYYRPMNQTCMCWGFDCGDGWFPLLWQLSLAIEDELKNIYPWYTRLFWRQIEWLRAITYKLTSPLGTFFGLRGSKYFTNNPSKVMNALSHFFFGINDIFPYLFSVEQVKEKYGTLRFYCSDLEATEKFVDLAERVSAYTCEECGEHGHTRGAHWLYTACAKHSQDCDLNPKYFQDRDEMKARGIKFDDDTESDED